MISTPFIDNWIVTGSKVINYHLSNFVDQRHHQTFNISNTASNSNQYTQDIPFKFLSNYELAPLVFLHSVWADVSNEVFFSAMINDR